LQLTLWIRQALESGTLTIAILRRILKSDLFGGKPPQFGAILVKRQRLHKVECLIFPSREVSGGAGGSGLFRRELVLDYESARPSGCLRVLDPSRELSGGSDDEITFLLPDTARSSCSTATPASPVSFVSSYGQTVLQLA
jgi:hypothetical protein